VNVIRIRNGQGIHFPENAAALQSPSFPALDAIRPRQFHTSPDARLAPCIAGLGLSVRDSANFAR
jgi:hypothetical protein